MSDVVALSDCRSQGCRDWVRAGRPYKEALPVSRFQDTLSAHGLTVYTYPDKAHLAASRPEDHTPFSETGWPAPAPRWYGNAADVMPRGGSWESGGAELVRLARQILADKDAGVPGTEWIKYMNWTDENRHCWQTSWKNGRVTLPSTDEGHVHVSGRSDMVLTDTVPWDPWARMNGGGSAAGEDEDMGTTYIDGQIPDTTGGAYNINLGIVGAGAADPRPAWIGFTNDLNGAPYGLRIMWTGGDNVYHELELHDAENFGNAGAVLHGGRRAWAELPRGAVSLSVIRQAVKDGKPVAPSKDNPAYAGPLGFSIERGAVQR